MASRITGMSHKEAQVDDAASDADPGPAGRLLARLTHGRGRYSVIAGTLTIWVMDTLLSRRLESSGAVTGSTADVVRSVEQMSTVLFIATQRMWCAALSK